ncbi:MAG: hypothetical protein MdMp014T_0603 [Treponematales bacterium]
MSMDFYNPDNVYDKKLAMVGNVLGATLTDSEGKLVTNATFQWKRGTSGGAGFSSSASTIEGAKGSAYTLAATDVGKYIGVVATNTQAQSGVSVNNGNGMGTFVAGNVIKSNITISGLTALVQSEALQTTKPTVPV